MADIVTSRGSRVFIWKDLSEWKSSLEDMFKDILTPELESKVRQSADQIEGCDDRIACEEVIGKSIEDMITSKKINQFRQRYSYIRVYHGCRPVDVQNYYDKGLLTLTKTHQEDKFRSIFLSGKFPELTEEILQQCIKHSAPYSVNNNGELCLAIDDKHIVERCGHYLVYGSEYLDGLVTSLHFVGDLPVDKYKGVLRQIGKPTFIEINIPATDEYVCDSTIYSLLYRMLTEWVFNVGHLREASCEFDYTLSFREPIQPEHICSHFHPMEIPDPGTGCIYCTETGEYTKREDSIGQEAGD